MKKSQKDYPKFGMFFFPSTKNHFMCPTCLDKIPLTQKDLISEAHIIPESAGGKPETFLCRKKCNSFFGTNQDKWFGEIIRLNRVITLSL
jgi:hypothetical protein